MFNILIEQSYMYILLKISLRKVRPRNTEMELRVCSIQDKFILSLKTNISEHAPFFLNDYYHISEVSTINIHGFTFNSTFTGKIIL